METSEVLAGEIQNISRQPSYVALASEKYALASEVAQNVQSQKLED